MTQQHRNNYFKLVALIVDVAYLVISKYIKEKILGPDSFETFLNKEKHKLVHIYETSQCCECRMPSIKKEKLISRKQLLILYKSDEGNQIRDHKKYANNKLTQICICEYSAKAHIDVRVVDITLANYIIQKCGKHALGIDNWIEQIKDVRNEIFHRSDIQEMTDQIFGIKWTKLEGSIMGIAKEISSDYADEAEKHIMQTQKLTIIGDYMLKYEIICRDYWRNKCAEFERAQNQVIEEKAAALHHTMPKLFSRSMEKECHQTMRKIQTLDSMVNMINVMVNIFGSEENLKLFDDTELVMEDNKRILIPVFMQLDIPISWDKTKVFEAIDKFRLTGTPDMNIRIKAISIDDLSMYAEIAKQVLGNVHELRSEINKLMSTMLSDAEIDTMENAEMCVNLNVPDTSASDLPPQREEGNDTFTTMLHVPSSITKQPITQPTQGITHVPQSRDRKISDRDYVPLSNCRTGTVSRNPPLLRPDSVDSVPDEIAPPPPVKRGQVIKDDVFHTQVYGVPPKAHYMNVTMPAPKICTSSESSSKDDSTLDVYDVPPPGHPRRHSLSTPRLSSSESHKGDSAYSSQSVITYDYPPSSEKNVLSDGTYDYPPTNPHSLPKMDDIPPVRPPPPKSYLQHQEPYQNIPPNSKMLNEGIDSLDINKIVPMSTNLSANVPLSYDFPSNNASTQSAYDFPTSGQSGSSLLVIPPPGCGIDCHSYINAATRPVSHAHEDMYLSMDGLIPPAVADKTSSISDSGKSHDSYTLMSELNVYDHPPPQMPPRISKVIPKLRKVRLKSVLGLEDAFSQKGTEAELKASFYQRRKIEPLQQVKCKNQFSDHGQAVGSFYKIPFSFGLELIIGRKLEEEYMNLVQPNKSDKDAKREDKKHNKTGAAFQKLLSLHKVEAYQMDLKAEFENSIFLDESLICRYILTNFQNIFNNIDILKRGLRQAMENRKPNCAKAIAWKICRQYASTVSMTHYYDIWPGFECGCKTNQRSDDSILCSCYIVIVAEVHKMEMISHKRETFSDIPIVYKEVNGHSDEAMSLMGEVDSTIDARKPYKSSQDVLAETATEFFTKHSKLAMISKSHLKSKGFGKENKKIERIPCIQFFCRAKGIIPIGEAHFPYDIGSIQTDIFEGFPTLQAKQIRIGSEFFVQTGEQKKSDSGQNATAIPNTEDEEMDIDNDVNISFKGKAGTIGGFLKYNGEDAFLTCAHVILSPDFLISHTFGYELHENPVKIYCKDDNSLRGVIPCGHLANITFPPNEINGVSIDAAIVKIDQNHAKIHIEDADKRELKSNYLHKCCLDWQEVGVNTDFEVRTFGAVSRDQHIKDKATIIEGKTVEFETLYQAVANVYRDIKPANTQDNNHFAVRALDIVSKRHSDLPQSIIFRNQIGMHKIKFQQGDSGMCIYVRHTDGKFWCIGMAIATHPAGGCIITPLKAILKHFNY